MRHAWRSLAVASLLLFIAPMGGPCARADSLLDRFENARPALQRQLRSRSVDARLEALGALCEYPLADAARIVHGCFADESEEVRERAYATLLAINGEQEVCDALVELADKGMHDRNWPRTVPPALAALLSSNLPIARLKTQQFLDTTIAASPRGPQIALAIADALGDRRQRADVVTLARLSRTKVFAENFGVRRAVVGALAQIPTKDAVGTLIGMLDRVGGEAKADASQYLTTVTGQIYGVDAAAWGRWWDQARAAFEYPHHSQNSPGRSTQTESPGGYYYGLPLFAERLVFVLDISGSMQGGRIVAAKRELARAIHGLPDHASFGIVVFNERVGSWKKMLVPADKKMKEAAIEYIEQLNPHSNTASYDALAAALTYDTEAIYFLSDGAPTSGKILAPVDIIAAITAANKVRRITIYTIGIAPGFPGSPTDAFLKTLADENFGQYRRVDG
ncbi:MAG: HEAT repeat domain-containing protein [Pirellulales bacterium]